MPCDTGGGPRPVFPYALKANDRGGCKWIGRKPGICAAQIMLRATRSEKLGFGANLRRTVIWFGVRVQPEGVRPCDTGGAPDPFFRTP
jgi:hypothetical protein